MGSVQGQSDDGSGSDFQAPLLEHVLNEIPQPQERERFTRFFRAATEAIAALGDLDLSTFEKNPTEAVELSLWERLAPDVRDTLTAVNAFLDTVGTEFGADVVQTDDSSIDLAFDTWGEEPEAPSVASQLEEASHGSLESKISAAAGLFEGIGEGLRQEMRDLGEALRKPVIVGSRFQLLDRLAEVRGKCRAGIGEMAFVAASVFVDVRKEDVVPFYLQDVHGSLSLRRALMMLRAHLELPISRAMAAFPDLEQVKAQVGFMIPELERFIALPVFADVRAADKRFFFTAVVELKASLEPAVQGQAVRQTIEGVARFLDSLSMINRRELLVQHDQLTLQTLNETLATLDATLVQATPEQARRILEQALVKAQELFGRDLPLDDVLLVLSCLPADRLNDHVTLRATGRLLHRHVQQIRAF